MAENSIPQSDPWEPGTGRPPHPKGVWLSEKEWAEAMDIDMAFFAAIRCEDVDNPHKIELLKCVRLRYSRLVASIDIRLNPA